MLSLSSIAAERVRYQVEVFDNANHQLLSASGDADTGTTSQLHILTSERMAPPVSMTVYPFYRGEQLVTLFGFNLPDMIGDVGYKRLLNANCGQVVSFDIGDSNNMNRFKVVLTPTKM
ncbi:MAG: hypothetical protein CTY38_01285 [Methylotenera sp.]|nr:MAG: hypothetical protein CTY38_01285 [Methylotenera sp.]